MEGLLWGAASGLWLGIMTSISPCPLATNVVAISYLSKRLSSPRLVLWTGLLYTVGRVLAYVGVGFLVVASLLSIPQVANWLQQNMNRILGPALIVVGFFLLEWIRIGSSGSKLQERMQGRADTMGLWGAVLLGFVFALSFCPISAALFFGSLIPLSVKHHSTVVLPSIYGIGTGLPVLASAVVLALGTQSIGKVFGKLSQIEKWARRVTGIVFVLGGIYYSLIFIFGVSF